MGFPFVKFCTISVPLLEKSCCLSQRYKSWLRRWFGDLANAELCIIIQAPHCRKRGKYKLALRIRGMSEPCWLLWSTLPKDPWPLLYAPGTCVVVVCWCVCGRQEQREAGTNFSLVFVFPGALRSGSYVSRCCARLWQTKRQETTLRDILEYR